MVNLVNERKQVVFGNDSIVIQKFIAGIKGGRDLDLTGYSAHDSSANEIGYIAAGHVIITYNGTYKPMPIVAVETYSEKTVTTGASVMGLYTKSGSTYLACGDADVAAQGTTYYEKNTVTSWAYGSLPANYSYAGILTQSISVDRPMAAIMTNGQVNSECVPFPMTAIASAFATACPHIEFIKDQVSV